jgi:hypothetical protein
VTGSRKIALLWRGDLEARQQATPDNNRWHRVFAELAALGIEAEPAVYCEEAAEAVRAQLMAVDGVLVWVDPLSNGRRRFELDALLRDVASQGIWVSTHPDVTAKIGVKEVLHTTRQLGWGVDTQLYRNPDALRAQFPQQLRTAGPRVIKQNRGNGGQGVWKVEALPKDGLVSVLQARLGSTAETMTLDAFMDSCEPYFADGGCVIDQPFQPRLSDGMIRCYVGADRVVGFGHQFITALLSPDPPGPRIMHGADTPAFQALRTRMETEWIPGLMQLHGLTQGDLPIIWDADFLYGPRTPAGEDTFVLCEINVSSVMPIPDQAPQAIARLVWDRLARRA